MEGRRMQNVIAEMNTLQIASSNNDYSLIQQETPMTSNDTSGTSFAGSSSPAASPSTPKKSFNPTYSRKFLSAKSPLIPTYDSLPPISTLHQDSFILRITQHLVLFPVQGPGGRLGIHSLAKKGRLPTGGSGYLSGGVEIADFACDPFESGDVARIAIAGEDGLIRLWEVGKEGIEGSGPEPNKQIKGEQSVLVLCYTWLT